jgi:hypothetical protein
MIDRHCRATWSGDMVRPWPPAAVPPADDPVDALVTSAAISVSAWVFPMGHFTGREE